MASLYCQKLRYSNISVITSITLRLMGDSGWCHRKGVQVDQGEEPAEGKNSWLGPVFLRNEQTGEKGWYGDVYG